MLEKDIKILWGRSGNRCAICKTKLSQDKQAVTASFALGEMAHIVGEKEGAARGKSPLTEAERNSYHNLILLCPTHHTEIDKNEDDWPIERLHLVKSQHELWVEETLAETADLKIVARQAVCAAIIDEAVDKCKLKEWKNWTSFALAPDPQWPADLPDDIFEFRQRVIAAVWPEDVDELKRAVITFSIIIHKAAQTYMQHSERQGNVLFPTKFYRSGGFPNPNYDEDLEKYNEWLKECYRLINEATKAANWLADIVRRDINPMFFAPEGKFLLMDGPFLDDLSFRVFVTEYTEEEKKGLPESMFKSNA